MPRKVNEFFAAAMNFFVPGLGYVYIGTGKRMGFSWGILTASVLVWIYLLTSGDSTSAEGPGGAGDFFMFLAVLLSLGVLARDAYEDATDLNRLAQ